MKLEANPVVIEDNIVNLVANPIVIEENTVKSITSPVVIDDSTLSFGTSPPSHESSHRMQRVLVVDDDPLTLRSLSRDLKGFGWQVDTATSQLRALSMTAQAPYDVVLTDLHLRNGCGLDLVRAIHKNNPHIKFILITGDTTATIPADELFISNIASLTYKPWNAIALDATLRKASTAHQSNIRVSQHPRKAHTSGRVLLVEDNSTDAMLAEAHLARAGNFDIVRVTRLWDAVAKLHEGNFDVVLTDLTLPDARGIDAVSRIVEAAPTATIVVLSGREDEALSLEAIEYGAQDYLVKDRINPYSLAASLRFSRERKRTQLRLEQLAHEDPLTGLFNRRMFHVRLSHLIARTRRAEQYFAVFFIDLDHFKSVNDKFGHDVGDSLLKEVAQRIVAGVREHDTAARMGGDEFAVLVEDLQDPEEAQEVAKRLVKSLGAPYSSSSGPLHVTSSIGVAVFPDAADNQEELLNCADAAMYEVKRTSRNGYFVYCSPER